MPGGNWAERMAEGDATPSDDLLRPSLGEVPDFDPDLPAPWRPQSQVYLAFFGGLLAVTVIAYLNGERLRMPMGERRRFLFVGLSLALLSAFVFVGFLLEGTDLTDLAAVKDSLGRVPPREYRWGKRLVSVLWAMLMVRQQRPYERSYLNQTSRNPDEVHASLWKPGFLAALAMTPVDLAILFAVAFAVVMAANL